MLRYIFKRLLMLIPVILGITFVVFMLLSYAPGDPAEIILGQNANEEAIELLREDLGLNDPRLIRYFRYLGNLFKGDFGTSYKNNTSVAAEIAERLPNTILLATSGIFLSILIGIPVGIISAKKQFSIFDNISMVSTLIGASTPAFWLGLLFVIIFSLKLKWFPSSGMGDGIFPMLKSMALPCLTIAIGNAAIIARMTRSTMLEVIREDYVVTARSKGIGEGQITRVHMLRNAMIPVVTVIGVRFGALLGGSVMTETVFSWPGLGKHVVDAVQSRDMPTVLGCVVVLSIVFSLVNLFVDVIYACIDPRIKAQYKKVVRYSAEN